MARNWMDELASFVEIRRDEPMSAHTSFRIGGTAEAMAFVQSRRDVAWLVDRCWKLGVQFKFLGNGTNVLVADSGVSGLVINLKGLDELTVCKKTEKYAVLFAHSGVELKRIVDWCVEENYSGLEFAAGIPGTVGGAIAMNAGTSSGEMKGVVKNVLLCDPFGHFFWAPYLSFSPSYRNGGIPKGFAVLGGEIVLTKAEQDSVKDKVERYIERRRERQPYGALCAGSVFKNPPNDYAARMIEELGLKGFSLGGAKVSEVHANFIVNEGASAKDVFNLINFVRDKVRERFNIELELEIELWGFGDVSR